MIKLIPEKNYEQMMRTVVEPGLAAMREEINMPLSTGGTLHAEVYNRLDAQRVRRLPTLSTDEALLGIRLEHKTDE